MATWTTVHKIAGKLPEAEESTSYGTPALKVKNKLFARLRNEDGTVVVYTDDKEGRTSERSPAATDRPEPV